MKDNAKIRSSIKLIVNKLTPIPPQKTPKLQTKPTSNPKPLPKVTQKQKLNPKTKTKSNPTQNTGDIRKYLLAKEQIYGTPLTTPTPLKNENKVNPNKNPLHEHLIRPKNQEIVNQQQKCLSLKKPKFSTAKSDNKVMRNTPEIKNEEISEIKWVQESVSAPWRKILTSPLQDRPPKNHKKSTDDKDTPLGQSVKEKLKIFE